MEISIYRKEYSTAASIDNFLDFYYSLQMRYLASDLLIKGLSPQQISNAILKAIKVSKSSGIEIRKHFMPVFTEVNKEIISDCKLSKLGFGLVLMNADARLSAVGKWQVSVLEKIIE